MLDESVLQRFTGLTDILESAFPALDGVHDSGSVAVGHSSGEECPVGNLASGLVRADQFAMEWTILVTTFGRVDLETYVLVVDDASLAGNVKLAFLGADRTFRFICLD